MPKMKTNRGAVKRFKKTGSGRIKHRCANRNHILTKKATKRKRQLRSLTLIAKSDEKSINRMMLTE